MSTQRNALELAGATWFKSSYSDQTGGTCVEVANLILTHTRVAVRDSKAPQGPALLLPPEAFLALVESVKGTLP